MTIIAIGHGFFISSITPLFGEIYKKNNEVGREIAFTTYYLVKNIGALLAPLICGYVSVRYNYRYAFLINSFVMFSGVFFFMKGKRLLNNQISATAFTRKKKQIIFLIYLGILIAIPIFFLLLISHVDGDLLLLMSMAVFVYIFYLLRQRSKKERKDILSILLMLIIVIVFSMFLGQGGTTINLFIDRIINRYFLGHLIPTAEFYALDPIFMLSIGPLFVVALMFYSKKKGDALVCQKLSGSLFLLGIGFAIFLLASTMAVEYGHASALYVVVAYLMFPLSELLLFPTIMSQISKLSPKDLSGFMMGIFMLAQSIAGYFMGIISNYGKIEFQLSSLEKLKNAASIYQHFFFYIALALMGFSVVTCGVKYIPVAFKNSKLK